MILVFNLTFNPFPCNTGNLEKDGPFPEKSQKMGMLPISQNEKEKLPRTGTNCYPKLYLSAEVLPISPCKNLQIAVYLIVTFLLHRQ